MQNPYELAQNILKSTGNENTVMNRNKNSEDEFSSIDLYGTSVHKKWRMQKKHRFHRKW